MVNPPEASHPAPSEVAAAKQQGILIGIVVGLIIGAVAAVLIVRFMPEMSQNTPKVPPAAKGPGKTVPSTPVTVSTSGQAPAKTLTVKNTGTKELTSVVLEVNRPRTRETKRMELGTMAAGATKDLGPKDWDWQMTAGDVVEVTAEGFSAASYTEP